MHRLPTRGARGGPRSRPIGLPVRLFIVAILMATVNVLLVGVGTQSAGARSRATGYGSRWLGRASVCASGLRYLNMGALPRLPLIVLRLPYLIAFLLMIPRTRVRLSGGPAGELIRAHLQLRRWGLPRYRLAQGVLHLPADFATYMRGRRRQALRTNVSRARSRGIRCTHTLVRAGRFGPGERWQAWNRAGVLVGEAWVTIDDECALLHSLVTSESDVRWLLHTVVVERLCGGGCRQLLTDSHDAFLMPAGQQHFQRLLGYSVERINPAPLEGCDRDRRRARTRPRSQRHWRLRRAGCSG
jgi:hypothetical protein